MTREIKFRGIRLDNGEWAYGDLIQNPNGISIYWTEPYSVSWQEKKVKVDPETVGQYTGIKDKNGKEIWEEDIILFSGIEFEISYSDGCFWFSNEEETMELHSILGMGEIEVTGNIHDNPELLKGE